MGLDYQATMSIELCTAMDSKGLVHWMWSERLEQIIQVALCSDITRAVHVTLIRNQPVTCLACLTIEMRFW